MVDVLMDLNKIGIEGHFYTNQNNDNYMKFGFCLLSFKKVDHFLHNYCYDIIFLLIYIFSPELCVADNNRNIICKGTSYNLIE